MSNRVFAITFNVLFLIFLCSIRHVHANDAAVPKDESLVNDQELLGAMETFMGMSAEEREETMRGLMAAVGSDPAKRAEMEALLKLLPEMEDNSNLQQMVHDDEIAKAKQEARRQLDGSDWDSFWANQAEILETVLASGQLSPEDAARFKTDEDAWKVQLKIIWDDLQKQGGQEL